MDDNRFVFINCPFDSEYLPLFRAILFTIYRSGFRPRCALEVDDASQNRLDKICEIIKVCRYGIHDISRTESDGAPPLPRFNMPLELGLFLGTRKFGGAKHRMKKCIIFDKDRFRYQRFISDIAGQDIHAHGNSVDILITELVGWLRDQSRDRKTPGGTAILREFLTLNEILPALLSERQLQPHEITYGDYCQIIEVYLGETA